MNHLIRLKTTAPPLLMTVTLICLGLLPTAQAVSPPPDGGYPGANTAEGTNALLNLTSGIANTAVGNNALLHTTTGNWNVGIGSGTLASNTTGSFNMAIGTDALTNNTANYNLAIGFRVGFMNTTGNHLTGIGAGALQNNTIGDNNTATGANALHNNTDGVQNTACGSGALYSNTTGDLNTANGFQALFTSTTGFNNTATGWRALFINSTGTGNTANGFQTLLSNTDGRFNTACGAGALNSNITGNLNTALGVGAGSDVTTADNVICIGAAGADVSNSCFIGNIRDVTTQNADAIPVLIDSNFQLGTASSSRRYKTDIKPLDNASESILALKPVSFRYKVHKDSTPQFGLIAEEVAEVNRDLVIYDADGKPYTVRYDAVNAMLLNEFLKEHRKVEQLTKDFESKLAEQQKQITALTASLQKVSAQLEASKPAPQVVNNP